MPRTCAAGGGGCTGVRFAVSRAWGLELHASNPTAMRHCLLTSCREARRQVGVPPGPSLPRAASEPHPPPHLEDLSRRDPCRRPSAMGTKGLTGRQHAAHAIGAVALAGTGMARGLGWAPRVPTADAVVAGPLVPDCILNKTPSLAMGGCHHAHNFTPVFTGIADGAACTPARRPAWWVGVVWAT